MKYDHTWAKLPQRGLATDSEMRFRYFRCLMWMLQDWNNLQGNTSALRIRAGPGAFSDSFNKRSAFIPARVCMCQLTQVDVDIVAADAAAKESKQPALTPDRNILSGCIRAFFLPTSPTIAVTSFGVYASNETITLPPKQSKPGLVDESQHRKGWELRVRLYMPSIHPTRN